MQEAEIEIPEPQGEECPTCLYELPSIKGCVINCPNCGNEYHSCGD